MASEKKMLGGRCYIGAKNCSHTAIRVSRQAERRPLNALVVSSFDGSFGRWSILSGSIGVYDHIQSPIGTDSDGVRWHLWMPSWTENSTHSSSWACIMQDTPLQLPLKVPSGYNKWQKRSWATYIEAPDLQTSFILTGQSNFQSSSLISSMRTLWDDVQ